ncbi:alpha/beta hydrolase [Polaribacter batillariae]|uniref:Alpha/beta hydrolase n=1 Tax=Polaribacter batillariae TaxID=2808900 RepID=A0ABX7SXU4_9FLAO|nr:alpha/beta hydrolase [Polaribacter batillariae]QTD38133.1 alpha/beta hydrolase [Polaribacter batillariae]
MKKIPIYFVPGLAAGPEIFENLELDPKKYRFYYLKWIKPLALEEDIDNYACRMSDEIKEKNPVLVGVSFGGIMVQEMAKFVNPRKVIIISSIKNQEELPKRFKFAKFTKAYKLFPTVVVENFEEYARYFLGKSLKKKAILYKKYLSVRNKKYLKWSIYNIIKWQQINPLKDVVHIHGTKDTVFPLKNIKNAIEIKGGTHAMILTKAKKISQIIDDVLTC